MTVLAAEAAPAAAAAAPESSAALQGAALSSGAQAGPRGGEAMPGKGVMLAIAIALLWLAAFCFFIAFEGSTLLGEQADLTGGGLLKAMLSGLAQKAVRQEQAGTPPQLGSSTS